MDLLEGFDVSVLSKDVYTQQNKPNQMISHLMCELTSLTQSQLKGSFLYMLWL